MSLSDGITLVDIDGHPVPTYEKGLPPHDPTDASQWLPSYEVDCVHYELPPDEMDELEAAAISAECDRRDAVDPPAAHERFAWLTLVVSDLPPISGGAPEPFEPTAEDWADYHAWSEDLDRRRRQVSDVELSMMAGGLAIG
jgi:hypothetical protein